MGGGSSGNNQLASPADSAGLDPAMIKAFANSTQGSKYNSDEIAALGNAHTYAGGTRYTNGPQRGLSDDQRYDITGLVNEFNSWAAIQAASSKEHNAYATAANAQQGRDATILTGASVSPNSILGAPAPLNPLVSTTKRTY